MNISKDYSENNKIMILSLCSVMDLIAIVTVDGTLVVHRTLNLSKVLSIKLSEICPLDCNISVMNFDNGKVLVLGFADGNVGLLDIETSSHMIAYSSSNISSTDEIMHIKWFQNLNINSNSDTTSMKFGYHDESTDVSSKDGKIIKILSSSLENHVLVCFSKSAIVGYLHGFFPLFRLSIETPSYSISNREVRDSINANEYQSYLPFFLESVTTSNEMNSGGMNIQTVDIDILNDTKLLHSYKYYCRHLSQIHHDIEKLSHIVNLQDKKWRDINKTLSAKFTLLDSLLKGYELGMNPIQFLYSVALCGKWHPAAVTHFSQHWNDQGIIRLKSEIDTTSKNILRSIFQLLTTSSNLSMKCRHLERLMIDDDNFSSSNSSCQLLLQILIKSSEQLIYKIDEAHLHANRAREGLLKFLQFVKENTIFPDSPNYQNFKFDLSLKDDIADLLDPVKPRVDCSFIESVTASYLYAYLRNDDLPSCLYQGHEDATKNKNKEETILLFQTVDNFMSFNCNNNDTTVDSKEILNLIDDEFVRKKSLSQQINILKQIFSQCQTHIMENILLLNSQFYNIKSYANVQTYTTTNILCYDVLRIDDKSDINISNNINSKSISSIYVFVIESNGNFQLVVVLPQNNNFQQVSILHIPFCVPKTVHITKSSENSLLVLGTGISDIDSYFYKINLDTMNFTSLTNNSSNSIDLENVMSNLTNDQTISDKKIFKNFIVAQSFCSTQRGTICMLDKSKMRFHLFDFLNDDN